MTEYIHQHENWTDFRWQDAAVGASLGEVRLLQGMIMGLILPLGLSSKEEKNLDMLTSDVLNSFRIEGEELDPEQVRSSVARRLGLNVAGLVKTSRYTEGVVEMVLDGTQNYLLPLTEERLFGWHASLFPTGYSGMNKIAVAQYRTGEMKVASGAIGKEKVHYEAVAATEVKKEMDRFLQWFNDGIVIDPILKSAIAHLWFVIIHPFDDGNGRIARAISDMVLARSENSEKRFYSLSKQLLSDRGGYYDTLKKVQRGNGDISEWLIWFLHSLRRALEETEESVRSVLLKTLFWEKHADVQINERQRMIINMLFDDFFGKITSSKWAKITKCSTDTALRDINDLMEKGILIKGEAGGRSSKYELART
ncbi:MAG: Fic family protein [Methanomassiliicoccaceae archaeon]|nr:Fic family protein [Methanomassiliicoccaceae archaeon]